MARKIAGKGYKTALMRREKMLRQHIPPTYRVTKQRLYRMLSQYGMVYVKPDSGSQGRGVMRMEKHATGKHRYWYQLGERKWSFATYEQAYASISKQMGGERHVVQKGIRLLRYNSRPFDIRLMVQRTPQGGLETTGTFTRVAHPRKVVTNGSQGGSIYATDRVLRRHAGPGQRRRLYRLMDQLGKRAVKALHAKAHPIHELGMDFAVDRKLKPWILEANTIPDAAPFTLLEDQSMIRRIVRYGRAYGKKYKLVCKKAKRGR
ncbi:YheC/YheD family protein [Paenibacillus sp. 1P07SE]|uniref:YheC/YheD family protein n=1 Tax=Paenibacillus sp. 1P07SE TaxID=3132209 RepID=UPI0039A4707D